MGSIDLGIQVFFPAQRVLISLDLQVIFPESDLGGIIDTFLSLYGMVLVCLFESLLSNLFLKSVLETILRFHAQIYFHTVFGTLLGLTQHRFCIKFPSTFISPNRSTWKLNMNSWLSLYVAALRRNDCLYSYEPIQLLSLKTLL